MTPRRLATAGALVVASWSSTAAALPEGARAWFVGPECRVRAGGPIDCDEVRRVRRLVGETVPVQLVVEAGRDPVSIVVSGEEVHLEEQLFVPVRARSRGKDPAEALPWAAAARPADDTILGEVADPLVAREVSRVIVPAGGRRAWWITPRASSPGSQDLSVVVEDPTGGPVLRVETLARVLPPPVIPVFAYFERDEPRLGDVAQGSGGCQPRAPAGTAGEGAMQRLLEQHGVLPVDRATGIDELGMQLVVDAPGVAPAAVRRDLVVLGAYGSLGEPTDDALQRVEVMAAAVPEQVRDVVLYAIDESCDSDLGARWRQRLRGASGAARRVKVLVTCSEDPTTIDADVVMTTAERFRPSLAAAARAQGKQVWVYNGRLPQAGPMALDAPPESMTWLGWIAARHDVRRWFLWNVNHWSDGNRGGLGPRDPYADPETFHNADGDAVLLDGLLVYPPRTEPCPSDQVYRGPLVRSVRLARLQRGLEDAALLGLAASIDPEAAREALDLVVPRALGDVPDDHPTPFGDGRALARARAMLHEVLARSPPPQDSAPDRDRRHATGRAGLVVLRARSAALALVPGALSVAAVGSSRGTLVGLAVALAVAACLGGGVIAAQRLARRRASR